MHAHTRTQDLIRPKGTDLIRVTEAHQDQTGWVISIVIRGNHTEQLVRTEMNSLGTLTHASTLQPRARLSQAQGQPVLREQILSQCQQ